MKKIPLYIFPFFIIVLLTGCDRQELLSWPIGSPTASISPRALLNNTTDVKLQLSFRGYAPEGKLRMVYQDGTILPARFTASGANDREVLITQVPAKTGWLSLEAVKNGKVVYRISEAVNVIDTFNIVLTFDDGPAADGDPSDGNISGSSSTSVLNCLDNFRHGPDNSLQGVSATFFVLSTPDKFLMKKYVKGETSDGAAVLREISRRGHVIGAHWGGRYGGQTVTHPKRVNKPPYDWSNSGKPIGKSALESDLLECMHRIQEVTGQEPKFLRPPLWKYKDSSGNGTEVLDTYKRLGLKMILTDAKYPDGGYAIISHMVLARMRKFQRYLQRAYLSGEQNIVITMHDSNTLTAKNLPLILEEISNSFAVTSFGGAYGKPGKRLKFAQTAGEVQKILNSKKRFAAFPSYNKQGTAK